MISPELSWTVAPPGPWPSKFVNVYDHSETHEAPLQELLKAIDFAENERPIQKALERHPELLARLLHGGGGLWIFSQPKLGSRFIPDFAMVERDSDGFHWWLVELESPTKRAQRKDGRPTSALNQALGQIRDWRTWLLTNAMYAQSTLGFHHLDSTFDALVVIGRRQELDPVLRDQRRALTLGSSTQIMSYDRLLEKISGRSHLPLSDWARGTAGSDLEPPF